MKKEQRKKLVRIELDHDDGQGNFLSYRALIHMTVAGNIMSYISTVPHSSLKPKKRKLAPTNDKKSGKK